MNNGRLNIRLVLVRHASTDMSGRFCGHSDPELNDLGFSELPGIVRRVLATSSTIICSSDLKRCRQTANAIATAQGLAVEGRVGLREINFGSWEGLCWQEIEARDPVFASKWLKEYPDCPIPGGESLTEFRTRVDREVHDVSSAYLGKVVTVVTHAGFIRAALLNILGMPNVRLAQFEQENGAITELRCLNGKWTVLRVNAL